ncbi:MFS transporter [Pseudalgibacter alginicilyticus]|uniref:MFS transporter n=1 Tax=Pseudalgibacter alginicilyticus TaxID=1736674 RepID=A0A0P0D7S1_9FLAO|nr:MFS transporter [Pseudalgibacter alginicilyticus]ALJ03651.1 MFS transporter [Pseudalgibacter alginicilyticus]
MTKKNKQRISLSVYFLLSGVCFASWASRIPTIKTLYNLNDAELGNLLLVLPISSLIGLPISGWLVSKFDSRKPLIFSFILFSIALILIGISDSIIMLIVALFLFAFNLRILNISVNTQSLTVQKSFTKKIIGSFHGVWSSGSLLGVGFSTLMVKMEIPISYHFISVALVGLLVAFLAYPFLLKQDKSPHGNKLILGKPDKMIMLLGIIIFFAAVCEGGMFDWSGVYFKDVVKEDVFTLGYLIFILFMTLSRFFSDILMDKIGFSKLYILSSTLIASGVLTAIIFPYFWPALIGFSIVGIGVAAIFPMTFMLAGTSKKYSAGMAVSIITTYAIAGMLMGPPLLGYIAHAFNLKISFLLFVFSALMFIPISKLFFKYQKKQA